MKLCKKCKNKFKISQLRERGNKSGNIYYICQICFLKEKEIRRIWELKNKDKIKKRSRERYAVKKGKAVSEIKKYEEYLESGFKVCNKCKEEKEISLFPTRKLKNKKTSPFYICIECNKLASKAYRKKNKERIHSQYKKYYKHNREKILKSNREWEKRNRKKRSKIALENYYRNREAILKKKKEEYSNNPEKYRKRAKKRRNDASYKKWIKENRARHKEYRKEYYRNKRKHNPEYRLRKNVSKCVNDAIKREGSRKGGSILDYLPYTIEELKQHLESQFEDWMNWDNWGEWHIDHIIPQSKLKYDSMEHPNFKKCWALNNLRPMEAIANIKKGNKLL